MKDLNINEQTIAERISLIRGQNVMFDVDLAALYEVETKQLKRQVRRNIDRFPGDFMFELTSEEVSRCQFGTLKQGGNIKYAPMVFTEQGVAMLSSVLNSVRAIQLTYKSSGSLPRCGNYYKTIVICGWRSKRSKVNWITRIKIWRSCSGISMNCWKQNRHQNQGSVSVINRTNFKFNRA